MGDVHEQTLNDKTKTKTADDTTLRYNILRHNGIQFPPVSWNAPDKKAFSVFKNQLNGLMSYFDANVEGGHDAYYADGEMDQRSYLQMPPSGMKVIMLDAFVLGSVALMAVCVS